MISQMYTRVQEVDEKHGLKIRFLLVFIIGLLIGFTFPTVFVSPIDTMTLLKESIIKMSYLSSRSNDIGEFQYSSELQLSYTSELLKGVEEVTTRHIAREIRVLCWINTSKMNHKYKAFHVKTTWGRHCNNLIFISDTEDLELPTVSFNIPRGPDSMWNTTIGTFKHVHDQLKDNYDWVLKADDDNYVLLENLRSVLVSYNPNDPLYFGLHIKPEVNNFLNGGKVYVLSKEAVRRIVTQAFDGQHKDCPLKGPANENIGKCLNAVGVKSGGDLKDSEGQYRSYGFDDKACVNFDNKSKNWWCWDYQYWPTKQGLQTCSDQPISFHNVSPIKMYMLEYLIYNVQTIPVMHLSIDTPALK